MSRTERPSLTSWNLHDEETMHVIAEVDGENVRTIYEGREPGQWALVPVEALEYDRPDYAEEMDIADLELLGDTATIEPEESSTMTLLLDDQLVVRGADPGVYGLLRIPFERE